MPPVASSAGALAVHGAGGALAVGLGGLERLAGERRDRRGASAGTERGVARRRSSSCGPAARVTMSATADCGEQLLQVGVVARLDVGPRRRRAARSPAPAAPRVGGLRRAPLRRRRDAGCRRSGRRPAPTSATRGARGSRFDREVGVDGLERGLEARAALGQHPQQQAGRGPSPTRPMAAEHQDVGEPPLGPTRCSTSHASPPSATDAASEGRNACGKKPWPTRRRSTKPSTSVPSEVRRAVAEAERRDLGGVALEREPADDHHRGADERARAGDDRRACGCRRARTSRAAKKRNVP